MIYLNTFHYEKNKEKYKNNIENLFVTTVMNEPLDDRDIELIKKIDKAEYIGHNMVCNSMGDGVSIEKLSRGLKTLLVIRWFIKNNKTNLYFNISSCGNNVIDSLVEDVRDIDIHFLTYNYTMESRVKADIRVNDKYDIKTISELGLLGSKLYASDN